MKRDPIVVVGIDSLGRLKIRPATQSFELIWREAMEIDWDREQGYLHGPPPPRSELATPAWWYRQIIAAVREVGCELYVTRETRWVNVARAVVEEVMGDPGSA